VPTAEGRFAPRRRDSATASAERVLLVHGEGLQIANELRGPDGSTVFFVTSALVIQWVCAYLVTRDDVSWVTFLVVAYSIGGMCNHSMTLAMHEISHNLASKSLLVNRIVGHLANAPLGIPAFISFKRYHGEHHKYQGEDGVDSDIPTAVEGTVVGANPLLKTVWMLCQPLFYAFRPLITVGKSPSGGEVVNFFVQVAFNLLVCYTCQNKTHQPLNGAAALYLVLSTLLGMGLHPMAGHFVAEHYTFVRGQETYSYYGPLNWFSFFVGYHNEHHDFPNFAGRNLRTLRDSAPDHYEHLPVHHSWTKVIWRYITSPILTPFSRIRRHTLSDAEVAEIRAE
jgi:sphingolipid 4-desaturase/C4-monooxygenase